MINKQAINLRSVLNITILIASVIFVTQARGSEIAPAQGIQPCDRACLEGFVDQYLDAMLAHDPSLIPTTSNVRFTENTVPINLGEALWQTITGLGEFKIYTSDPYSNQAGFMGVVMENGQPKLFALRLRIKNGKIKEIETIVTRESLVGPFSKEMSTRVAKAIWTETLKPSERVSRKELLTAANQYFEGMEANTSAIVAFDDSCNRTENGIQTTNNPELMAMMPDMPPPPPSDANLAKDKTPEETSPADMAALSCKGQFDGGVMGIFQTPVRDYWMIDEERGLVLGNFVFTVVGGTIAIPIAELFKIKNGRIYEIEAIGISTPLPHGSRTGW